jgi:hypothetical protein
VGSGSGYLIFAYTDREDQKTHTRCLNLSTATLETLPISGKISAGIRQGETWLLQSGEDYLVVQGEDMEKMKGCSPCIFGAPVCLVVCYDKNSSWKSRTGREIGDVDGGIVLTQMMYQAEDLGIGSLIVGIYKEPLLRERFNIPAHYEIVSLLMLGYPAQDSEPHPQLHWERKPLEETVFFGTF